MRSAMGRAPGKTILVGEHAVVYGHPAIAIPVRSVATEVTAQLSRGEEITVDMDGLAEALRSPEMRRQAVEMVRTIAVQALSVFGEEGLGLELSIRSTIPIARGLGSSAAVSVALVRAVCGVLDRTLGDAEVAELALEGEKLFHANPSGIDNNVVARERAIYYLKRKGVQPVQVGPTSFRFLIADTGVASRTSAVVEDVRRRREAERAHYDSLFWEIGSMTSVAREILRRGSRMELGMCMNRNHELLCELGVSSGEIEHLVEAARDAGAVGAKLTGAETEELRLAAALKQAGAKEVYETELVAGS